MRTVPVNRSSSHIGIFFVFSFLSPLSLSLPHSLFLPLALSLSLSHQYPVSHTRLDVFHIGCRVSIRTKRTQIGMNTGSYTYR
ncbi:hypothetical protein LZ30DRAFT_716736 [Colletotrichum cereale]|nr:hypothetical protein LZ30DRAFT_716736 [Colletotrichum cereale]